MAFSASAARTHSLGATMRSLSVAIERSCRALVAAAALADSNVAALCETRETTLSLTSQRGSRDRR